MKVVLLPVLLTFLLLDFMPGGREKTHSYSLKNIIWGSGRKKQ